MQPKWSRNWATEAEGDGIEVCEFIEKCSHVK